MFIIYSYKYYQTFVSVNKYEWNSDLERTHFDISTLVTILQPNANA